MSSATCSCRWGIPARYYGARTLELNFDPSAGSIYFDETRLGKAGILVPEWVGQMLG